MKVGDRFCFTKDNVNLLGTIIYVNDNTYGVEFDRFIRGHTCDSRGKPGHCLWLGRDLRSLQKLIPKNKLSEVLYPDFSTTDCGEYLVVKK